MIGSGVGASHPSQMRQNVGGSRTAGKGGKRKPNTQEAGEPDGECSVVIFVCLLVLIFVCTFLRE